MGFPTIMSSRATTKWLPMLDPDQFITVVATLVNGKYVYSGPVHMGRNGRELKHRQRGDIAIRVRLKEKKDE